jgi:hypothetical protein
MRATIAIDVASPPDLVFGIARDVTRWASILPHYALSRPIARHDDGSVTCLFVARRPIIPWLGLGVPVAWRSRTWSDPTTRQLRFRHVGGVTRGMDVTWRIEPNDRGGTHVEIVHVFSRGPKVRSRGRSAGVEAVPVIIERFFVRPIAGRTLATIRSLAEALVPVASSSPNHGPDREPSR